MCPVEPSRSRRAKNHGLAALRQRHMLDAFAGKARSNRAAGRQALSDGQAGNLKSRRASLMGSGRSQRPVAWGRHPQNKQVHESPPGRTRRSALRPVRDREGLRFARIERRRGGRPRNVAGWHLLMLKIRQVFHHALPGARRGAVSQPGPAPSATNKIESRSPVRSYSDRAPEKTGRRRAKNGDTMSSSSVDARVDLADTARARA